MAKYKARFLTLERFVPRSYATERERERGDKFRGGLRLSLQLIVATFIEAIMRALEVKNAHESR